MIIPDAGLIIDAHNAADHGHAAARIRTHLRSVGDSARSIRVWLDAWAKGTTR